MSLPNQSTTSIKDTATTMLHANSSHETATPSIDHPAIEQAHLEQRRYKAQWAGLVEPPSREPVLHKKTSVLLLHWDFPGKHADFDTSGEVQTSERLAPTFLSDSSRWLRSRTCSKMAIDSMLLQSALRQTELHRHRRIAMSPSLPMRRTRKTDY